MSASGLVNAPARRFGYLTDRLGCLSLGAYAVNRFWVRPEGAAALRVHAPWLGELLHSHFDDFLMMPAALPVILWLQHRLGLRPHEAPPTWTEMWAHLGVWTVLAKVVGPFWLHHGVADPWDVPYFVAGGVLACLWWQRPVKNKTLTS